MSHVTIKISSLKDLSLLSSAYKKGDIDLNISKLAKDLKCDRKTVKRYLDGFTPGKKRKREKYLDKYRKEIINVLNDEYQSFSYIDHLYRYMKREYKITCNRSTFNRYMNSDKEISKYFNHNRDSFFVRFETPPGHQVQFDLKEKVGLTFTNGNEIKVYIPTLTLGFSRYNYRKIILENNTENLLAFLAEAFEFYGGVPKQIVIDNLSPFVQKSKTKDSLAILNPKFEQFCKDYNIEVFTCMPSRPETKGKTETQNKIVEELYNYSGKYNDLGDIHKILEVIDKEDNETLSQATKLPRIFLYEKEKGEFNSLPAKEIRTKYHLTLNEVSVSNESLISYKACKYSVPKNYIGLKVGLVVRNDKLHIYYNKNIIAVHQITNNLLNIKDEHKLFYDKKPNKSQTINEIIIKEMEGIKFDND